MRYAFAAVVSLMLSTAALAATVNTLPHLQIDTDKKQVRVECEALNVDMPLEFFLVVSGTQDHEALLRSMVRPSHLHQALLMVGLQPGEPVRYSPSTRGWLPPHGPPLHITCEYEQDGKTISSPAYRWIRNARTKKPAPPFTWVFVGSRLMEDNKYAADVTGYLVSIVNFDLTVIDISRLASNANEALEWEYNPDVVPKTGTKVWLVIEPAGKNEDAAATTQPATTQPAAAIDVTLLKVDGEGKIALDGQPVALEDLGARLEKLKSAGPVKLRQAFAPNTDAELIARVKQTIASAEIDSPAGDRPAILSDVKADETKIKTLRHRWEKAVKPHSAALREAAQTQYEVIGALRREQQRLIDEADRVQRVIDQLEKEYQDMTTPRPESGE